MSPKWPLIDELRSLVRHLPHCERHRYLELLDMLTPTLPSETQSQLVRAHWAKYRAKQEFRLTSPTGEQRQVYGLQTLSQLSGLAVATLRKKFAEGGGAFRLPDGTLVVRV